MLSELYIKNIALIKELRVNFSRGLNILSGETGAGKSIIVDCIGFILGAKVDKTYLRSGEQNAVVEGVFEVSKQALQKIAEAGFDFLQEDEPIIITRSLNQSGKSDCKVNMRTVTASSLRQITAFLVDLHGQHEHQSLLNPSKHIKLLDYYAAKEIMPLVEAVTPLYSQLLANKRQLNEYGGDEQQRIRAMDLLGYQINEIEQAKLSEKEYDELVAVRQRIMNLEKIRNSLGGAYDCFSLEQGAINSVASALGFLSNGARYDDKIDKLYERLNSVSYELTDIADEVSSQLEDLDFDDNYADKIEKRLDEYKDLKRKYGATVQKIEQFYQKISEEYQRLENAEKTLQALNQDRQKILKQLFDACMSLSVARRRAAKALEQAIMNELDDLGMKDARFSIEFNDLPDIDSFQASVGSEGFDRVEFYLSANKGEPLKPLSKTISGGEMSRFMLALKTVSGMADGIETMIFDEIDSGISGKIGQAVATKFAHISKNAQILCVTHLSQIAAMADTQFLIHKSTVDDYTVTSVDLLDYEGMIDEIARLSGGKDISAFAKDSAREMKQWCDRFKLEQGRVQKS